MPTFLQMSQRYVPMTVVSQREGKNKKEYLENQMRWKLITGMADIIHI